MAELSGPLSEGSQMHPSGVLVCVSKTLVREAQKSLQLVLAVREDLQDYVDLL